MVWSVRLAVRLLFTTGTKVGRGLSTGQFDRIAEMFQMGTAVILEGKLKQLKVFHNGLGKNWRAILESVCRLGEKINEPFSVWS